MGEKLTEDFVINVEIVYNKDSTVSNSSLKIYTGLLGNCDFLNTFFDE